MIEQSRLVSNDSSKCLYHNDEASSMAPPTVTGTIDDGSSVSASTCNAVQGLDNAKVTPCQEVPRTISTTKSSKARVVTMLEAAGGSDKDPMTGHRRDTIPIMQAILDRGVESQVLQFREEYAVASGNESEEEVAQRNKEAAAHNDMVRAALLGTDGRGVSQGVIARNNPGTLSTASQAKFDALLVELDERGAKVMSHPEVVRRMGAKDALCKISHLRCGLEDTDVYYEEETFRAGFRKSIAFRPRVVKQNRGSQGEGIWICKLKDESAYCSKFGERIADLDTPLVLMEANDNHVEEHTVGEFIEFCINGHTAAAGEWTSTGAGKYLEGGIEAGAMLVDQRFLPRIVEGEIRCMMVGPNLVELIHKKPKEGGLSATLQSGATYTRYGPEAPEFANLVDNFKQDLPSIMNCFGMGNQPLPLLWTADYIFGDKDEHGKDTFYVGEFNCSCVGITQQLEQAHIVAETAVVTCFPEEKKKSVWSSLLLSPYMLIGVASLLSLVSVSFLGSKKRVKMF